MIKVGNDIEIERYAHGWEVREYREKQANHLAPNPEGKACKKRWFSTLLQACMHVVDSNHPDSGDAQKVVFWLEQTRTVLLEAIADAGLDVRGVAVVEDVGEEGEVVDVVA